MMNNPGSAKAAKTLEKLISLAGSTSSDTLSENKIFFVAPKAAKDSKNFDLTQVNLHVLKSIIRAKGMFI